MRVSFLSHRTTKRQNLPSQGAENHPPFSRVCNDDYNYLYEQRKAVSMCDSRRAISRSDHPATDRVEAGQLHSSSVLLSGEQWHLAVSFPCDNKRKRRTDLILSWRTRTTSSS